MLDPEEIGSLDRVIKYKQVSDEHEIKTLASVIRSLQQVVASYPSQQEELELMSNPETSNNVRTIVRLRLSEKDVLEKFIVKIQKMREDLLLKHKEDLDEQRNDLI